MATIYRDNLRQAITYGLYSGVAALSVSVIGMVELFGQRELISGGLTLGQVILFLAPAAIAYYIAQKTPENNRRLALIDGLIVGFINALPLLLLILLANAIDLRQFLINVSPALMDLLTFGQGLGLGSLLLIAVSSIIGVMAAYLANLPGRIHQPILTGLVGTFILGLFSEILSDRLRSFFGSGVSRLVYRSDALLPLVSILLFLLIVGLSALWSRRGEALRDRINQLPAKQQVNLRRGSLGLGILALLLLPLLLGTYLSEVINNVGIFVLMGLGLNIVVGYAGLLDLGYVAFFAIGAYSMATLTSLSALGITNLSFWAALPICVVVAVLFGVVLGLPVLRMRGDYLAIVTLGFGEIIRIMALSDLLKPFIGGAQGILQIPKPQIGSMVLVKPGQLYYVILGGCLLAAFVSWRLSEARIGRQWMAMREDEDVAEAMGISLVSTKILAFAIGAAFSGMSGAIFASKLTSIFPHSFNLLISINVLCLIIVGGMGSMPGVVVGALILVGLPELLREFAEYRLLMYGAMLIVMMLAKPEGFIPSAVRKRELRAHVDEAPISESAPAATD